MFGYLGNYLPVLKWLWNRSSFYMFLEVAEQIWYVCHIPMDCEFVET